MHQNAPFIPLNIKNGLPKEGGTPLLQPPPLASCGCSGQRRHFRLFLQNFLLFSNLSTSLLLLGALVNLGLFFVLLLASPSYYCRDTEISTPKQHQLCIMPSLRVGRSAYNAFNFAQYTKY